MWDDVYMKGGSYSGGGITQTMEINLIDKNTNSLKQLNLLRYSWAVKDWKR